jgi:hypothetical protein
MPSHFEVTFGTVGGNFLLVMLLALMELADDDGGFPGPCLRCC